MGSPWAICNRPQCPCSVGMSRRAHKKWSLEEIGATSLEADTGGGNPSNVKKPLKFIMRIYHCWTFVEDVNIRCQMSLPGVCSAIADIAQTLACNRDWGGEAALNIPM